MIQCTPRIFDKMLDTLPFFDYTNNIPSTHPPPLQGCFSCVYSCLPVHQRCSGEWGGEGGGDEEREYHSLSVNLDRFRDCQFYVSVPRIFVEDYIFTLLSNLSSKFSRTIAFSY